MLFLVWENKVSPFDVCRIFGERFFKNFLDEYNYIIDYCNERGIIDITFKEKLYICLNGLNEVPTCKNDLCHKPVNFRNTTLGYREYCSTKCISNDPKIKDIKEKKSLEKFGTKSPAQSDIIKKKIIQIFHFHIEPWCIVFC
jgi:hypothetical protein